METQWSCLVSVEIERKTDALSVGGNVPGTALDTITIEDVVLADSASDAMRQIGNVLKDLYGVDTSKSLVKKIDIKEAS